MLKARENAGVQVMIGFSFASDWLTKWHEYSGPITERSKAKPRQSQITFDSQLKIALQSDLHYLSVHPPYQVQAGQEHGGTLAEETLTSYHLLF